MTLDARPTGPAPRSDAPVRQESLRAHNLALTFRQIATAGRPISRIELVAQTGLTRPTISRIVEELLAGGLVAEAGPAHLGGAGRPRVGLTLSRQGPAGLGLDIRGDGLAACVVDLTGAVRHLTFAPGSHAGRPAQDTLAELARMARSAMRTAAEQNLTVVAGTLAVPGPVQTHSLVRFAPSLGWRDVDAGTALRRSAGFRGVPVTVENEANVAALGELHSGAEELANFVYVSGELGLGAGIVLHGELLRGARGWAGELGHVTVFPDGRPCLCGSRGCLQTYASLTAILDQDTDGQGPMPAASIAARADAGSAATLAALELAGTALGIALSDLVNVLDIDTILLGGSYALLASWLIDGIQTQVRQRVLTAKWSPVQVRPAIIGPDAAVIGAALTVVNEVRQNPATWLTRPKP